MITKQDAAILFAYGFKLVDKEGKEWGIHYPFEQALILIDDKGKTTACFWDKIGTDYWILKRPYSQLVETIQHEGKEIVPIVEVSGYKDTFEFLRASYFKKKYRAYFRVEHDEILEFNLWGDIEHNPSHILQKLYSLHFIDLPEGTYREME